MRPLLIALATALLFTAPAAAVDGAKELRGSIAALSATAITVKDGSKSATCSVARTSPPLAEYHVGDRVTAVCKRTGDRWMLTAIHKVVTKPKADQPAPKTPPTTDGSFKQGGKLTDVSATSVTVRDGDHDFVCKLGDVSPPLDGFHVGDHVVVVCKAGALVGITLVEVAKPTAPVVETTGQGTITAISTSTYSLTVHTDGGDVTCSLTADSPKLGDFHVGDLVKFGCRNHVLTAIYKTTAPATPVVERTGQGTISALSTTSLTVHTDGGDVTCSLGTESPKLGDYKVGDRVKFGCKNNVLYGIYKSDPAPAPTPAPVYRSGQGTVTLLTTSYITVHTDGGDVSCAVRDSSPKLGDFHVGDRVKFYCTNEVLSGIAQL
jgi:hypothetical protein